MLILVDCGTTNMRLRLYRGAEGKDIAGALAAAQPLDEIKYKTGVRDAVRERSDEILRETLGHAIREMLDRNSLAEADVEAVICSGTLSSHVGIYHIHHVVMPVSPEDTAAHSELVTMPDVSGIPILFIPGVKGVGDLMYTEVMSGEECELYGIAERMGITGAFTLLLPGSYNKIISVNEEGKIEKIYSSMCGELTADSRHQLAEALAPRRAVARHTGDKAGYAEMGRRICVRVGTVARAFKGMGHAARRKGPRRCGEFHDGCDT